MASQPAPPIGRGAAASMLPDSDTTASASASASASSANSHHSRSQTLDNVVRAAAALPFRFSSPIKRKPVSSSASLLVASRLSSHLDQPSPSPSPLAHTVVDLPRPDHRLSRPPSLDSPTLYDYPASVRSSFPAARLSDSHAPPIDIEPATASRNSSADSGPASAEPELFEDLSEYDDLISDISPDASPDAASPRAHDESSDDTSDIESIYTDHPDPDPPSPPMFASKPTPPHLRLEKVDSSTVEEGPRTHIDESPQSAALAASPQLNKPLPKSPGQQSPLTSLFARGNPSPSVTEFSSLPSPLSLGKRADEPQRSATNASFVESTKPDAATNPTQYRESYLSTPSSSTSVDTSVVDEMEEELKAISSELAASIRREIDLEDLVDRLQEQMNNSQAPGKRTSDYFSDSGYSSAKLSEYDQNREEIERIQRKSEQEKASLRLELTNKVQDEREKRKELDLKIKELVEKASEVDLAQINNMDASDRIKDLENTCEGLRRKLSEERESKSNFEDLLSTLKGELQDACNERDNLRDEIVPELRARVEGLETEAANHATLTYESTRMQQELQSLKNENRSLRNSVTGGPEDVPKRMSVGLSRSNSVATGQFRGQRPPGFGLARADSFKNAAQTDSREGLLERLKDVEAQRDALHSALKSLLERHHYQNREHKKKIRILENERQRLQANSPRKAGFEKDMSTLRTEISVLRRRAEDALEQKWQVEKGLGGLKMDLDRAEEEIESLRNLLKEKDILIPPFIARSSVSSDTSRDPVTSESLHIAYKELQDAYAESLERIKQLELDAGSEEATKLAVERLERSLSVALSERDAARREADGNKAQHSEAQDMAGELSQSADRIEQLASEVQQQLEINAQLRERLSEAVIRGETDRRANSDRIAELQERLRTLEDQVVSAQTASEDRVGRHEEEIGKLREAHNEQLRRLQNGLGDGVKPSPKSLLSSSVPAKSFEEEAEMETLRAHVAELETALAEAENEMQEVVARMNMAQVEVLNLQEDREAAVRGTRRLEAALKEEKSKASRGLFATLGVRA